MCSSTFPYTNRKIFAMHISIARAIRLVFHVGFFWLVMTFTFIFAYVFSLSLFLSISFSAVLLHSFHFQDLNVLSMMRQSKVPFIGDASSSSRCSRCSMLTLAYIPYTQSLRFVQATTMPATAGVHSNLLNVKRIEIHKQIYGDAFNNTTMTYEWGVLF